MEKGLCGEGGGGAHQQQTLPQESRPAKAARDRREGPAPAQNLPSRTDTHLLALLWKQDIVQLCLSHPGASWNEPLPRNAKKRAVQTHRYEKQVPGHHIQVDVKFLRFEGPDGKKIRRFRYTAIDDATRVRALQIYRKHTQEKAIRFVDYVLSKFPFRIHTVRTDNGHAFQA